MTRRALLLSLLLPWACGAAAQEADPPLRFESVRLGVSAIEPGGMLDLEAVLVNEGVEDWQEGAYSVSATLFSAEGRAVKRTRPILIRGVLAPGESRTLRIRKIRTPAGLSGDYVCRVSILSGGKVRLQSEKLAFRVVGAETPEPEERPEGSMSFSKVRLGAAEVEAGGKLDVDAVLVNEGVEDWPEAGYSVSAAVFSAAGRRIKRTRPLPIRRALSKGESRTLRIRKIRIPSTASGDCALQVFILAGDKEVLGSEKLEFTVTEAKPPEEAQALPVPAPEEEIPLPEPAASPLPALPVEEVRAPGSAEEQAAEPPPEATDEPAAEPEPLPPPPPPPPSR